MQVLLNRVWHKLKPMPRREVPREQTVMFAVRASDLPGLRELVARARNITLEASGLVTASCTIKGPAEAVEAFMPALQVWQHQCEAEDAW